MKKKFDTSVQTEYQLYTSIKFSTLIFVILVLFFTFWAYISLGICAEIALFPSFGCYSHDVMMKEVGTEFPDDKITWIQLQAYDFGFTANHLPKNWKSMIIKNDDEEGMLFLYTKVFV